MCTWPAKRLERITCWQRGHVSTLAGTLCVNPLHSWQFGAFCTPVCSFAHSRAEVSSMSVTSQHLPQNHRPSLFLRALYAARNLTPFAVFNDVSVVLHGASHTQVLRLFWHLLQGTFCTLCLHFCVCFSGLLPPLAFPRFRCVLVPSALRPPRPAFFFCRPAAVCGFRLHFFPP